MIYKQLIISILSILFIIFFLPLKGQEMPEWFQKNMEESVGVWTTSNEAYQNEQEPFDAYGMQWQWGIGQKSIVGSLYGIKDGQNLPTFWEFRQYWDPQNDSGMVAQFGGDGTIGIGPMIMKGGHDGTEMIQTFVNPKGVVTQHGHTATLKNGILEVTSYDIAADGSWSTRRSYVWHKQ